MSRTSRSKITSHFLCPRYRYLKYHYGQRGLEKITPNTPTLAGIHIHQANALTLQSGSVDDGVGEALENYNNAFNRSIPNADIIFQEQVCLIEGVARAFNRCRVPQLRALGSVVSIEAESSYLLGNDITYDFRADAIIETPEEMLVIIDFKPTPYGGSRFIKSYEHNNQVMAYVAAAEALYKKAVLGVQIEGYVRGKREFDDRLFNGKVKIQNSPLCYVYVNDVTGVVSPYYQRSGDWTKTPLWDVMETKEYIEEYLSASEVEKLFLSPIPPIAPNQRQLNSWKIQTVAEESRIEQAAGLVERVRMSGNEVTFFRVLDENFPQNHDACWKYGEDYPCEMLDVCYNGEVENDPLGSGLFSERKDHHERDDA